MTLEEKINLLDGAIMLLKKISFEDADNPAIKDRLKRIAKIASAQLGLDSP